MTQFRNFLAHAFVCTITLMLVSHAQASAPAIPTAPNPEWVDSIPASLESIKTPADDIHNGYYHVFYEEQIRADKSTYHEYTAFALRVTNDSGVEEVAQINVQYQPEFEQLQFHNLYVIRNQQVLDRLSNSSYQTLQRETDMENLIYTGYLTANIIVDDVQVGDTLVYAYSLSGANPIFNNGFGYTSDLQWSVPVGQHRLRILWDKDKPLYHKTFKGQTNIQKSSTTFGDEYLIENHNVSSLRSDSETPKGYFKYPRIYFSEYENWSEVIDWAIPLYQQAYRQDDAVDRIARDINRNHFSADDRIVAALHYVQNTIRYLGLEVGENSHRPSPPSETLTRKLGDCKDKTVLLIAILNALGIKSHPALVNTYTGERLSEVPPSQKGFNHVIVTLMHNGNRLWLDPTLKNQNNDLTTLFQPNYHWALPIEQGADALLPMDYTQPRYHIEVEETFHIVEDPNAPVEHTITTSYLGTSAERQRSRVASKAVSEMGDDYLNYYRDFYDATQMDQPVNIVDDDEHPGKVQVSEHYSINEFWQKDDSGHFDGTVYLPNLYSYIPKPDDILRQSPFSFYHPVKITHQAKLTFDEPGWEFENEQRTVENPAFKIVRTVEYDQQHQLVITVEYESRKDRVAADQIKRYLKDRDDALDLLQWSMIKYDDNVIEQQQPEGDSATEPEEAWDESILILALTALCLVSLSLFTILFSLDRKATNLDQPFYPIAPIKYATLQLLTIGLYGIYWHYRNWKAQNLHERRNHSLVRGIFYPFWFGPLGYAAIRYAEQNGLKATFSKDVISLLWFLRLATMGMFLLDYSPIVLEIAVLLATELALVQHINSLFKDDQETVHGNSRLRWRYLFLLPSAGILLLWDSAAFLGLAPRDQVTAGNDLSAYHFRFLTRNKIVSPKEKIAWFYSAALFNLKADGNGMTNAGVFSYWTENNNLYVETAKYEEIEDIHVEESHTPFDDTVITITRNDGSDYFLFISTQNQGDKRFAKDLMENWLNRRNTPEAPSS